MAEPLEKFVATPFGRTRCIVPARENPGQPPALLIHGSGGRADVWRPMLDLFGRINPIAIDLPGHAPSSGALLKSVEQCAAFVSAVQSALGLSRAVIVGQSLGGAIAQQYAYEQPERCIGIVIANSAPDFNITDARLRLIAERWDEAAAHYAAGQVSPRAAAPLVAAARRMIDERVPATFMNDLAVCNGFSSRPWASQLRPPVLIVAGHDDVLTAPARSVALLELIPHAEMIVFSPCGHCTMLEQPVRFAAEVDLFAWQAATGSRAA